MSNYILFDVGANWGTDSLDKTKFNPQVITYAFEPTPELASHLREQSKDYADRYNIYEIALSDYDGTSTFNIADSPNCDWGCSSLNEFSDNLESFWPGRPDFKFNRTIEVTVQKLVTWFETTRPNLPKIDYFHCDTQGSDLKVLQGMGDYIHLIQQGVIECAREATSKLYKQNHTLQEAVDFLQSKGFTILGVNSNDIYNNELNLHFKK